MKSEIINIPPELAPCGVYCGACPSFGKSCHGCASERIQKRKSKWACKLRTCCYSVKSIKFCIECDEFPCKEHRKKLLDSHSADPRFEYRHEVLENFKKFTELGLERYLEYQNEKWICPYCKGRVHWYYYKCSLCGVEFKRKYKNFA